MRITIEQAALHRVASRVASVAARKSTIPIIGNMLISAGNDGVWLTATDLDMEIRERVDAVIDQPGQITVSAASLSEIARNAPAGAEVLIDWNATADPRAQVRFGRSRYQLPVLPADDFPVWPELSDVVTQAMDAADLSAMLDHVHFAQSTEETRYYLCGTCIHKLAVDGRPTLRLIATDGHRLVTDERPVEAGPPMPTVILPRKSTAEFRRLLADAKGQVLLQVSPAAVALEVDGTRIVSKTIDGSYPDYLRVIPANWEREIIIDRTLLEQAVKRVSLISADKARSVKLSIDDEVLTLTVRNMEAGVADEEIEVQGAGDHFEIGFNARFILDITSQTDSAQLLFRVTDSGSPARLDPHPSTKGAAAIVNVLMPLRI